LALTRRLLENEESIAAFFDAEEQAETSEDDDMDSEKAFGWKDRGC
jgi:hypothetical protein